MSAMLSADERKEGTISVKTNLRRNKLYKVLIIGGVLLILSLLTPYVVNRVEQNRYAVQREFLTTVFTSDSSTAFDEGEIAYTQALAKSYKGFATDGLIDTMISNRAIGVIQKYAHNNGVVIEPDRIKVEKMKSSVVSNAYTYSVVLNVTDGKEKTKLTYTGQLLLEDEKEKEKIASFSSHPDLNDYLLGESLQ